MVGRCLPSGGRRIREQSEKGVGVVLITGHGQTTWHGLMRTKHKGGGRKRATATPSVLTSRRRWRTSLSRWVEPTTGDLLTSKALRAEKVEYVVAPYEADAQLCFLEREGYVDGVITEDSDLLVFGCKTVIFKLDKDGNCSSIDGNRMAMVRELPMHGWTELEFRRMAVSALQHQR